MVVGQRGLLKPPLFLNGWATVGEPLIFVYGFWETTTGKSYRVLTIGLSTKVSVVLAESLHQSERGYSTKVSVDKSCKFSDFRTNQPYPTPPK
jgi:hypothetical protein